jgi:hypothetical protein
MIESNRPEGQADEGRRELPKHVRDAAGFFIIAGVLCGVTGIWSAVAIIVRPNGLHRDVVRLAILDAFSTHPALFTIIQDLAFGALFAAVFIVGAKRLRQGKRSSRRILLAGTIALPVLIFMFGVNQGAPQIGISLVATILMFQRSVSQFLTDSQPSQTIP